MLLGTASREVSVDVRRSCLIRSIHVECASLRCIGTCHAKLTRSLALSPIAVAPDFNVSPGRTTSAGRAARSAAYSVFRSYEPTQCPVFFR